MDFDKLKLVEENTVIIHIVFKEHTLGYLFRIGNRFYIGVLHGKVLKGGLNWKNGSYMLSNHELKDVREATQEDFDSFKVSSKGHLTPC